MNWVLLGGLTVLLVMLLSWWARVKFRRDLLKDMQMSDAWMREHLYQSGKGS
jgi:hypothetical protein